MNTVSIIWIVVMLVLIIMAKRHQKVSIKLATGVTKRLVKENKKMDHQVDNMSGDSGGLFSKFKKLYAVSEGTITSAAVTSKAPLVEDEIDSVQPLNDTNIKHNMLDKKLAQNSNYEMCNFHFTYDYDNGTGELYMRCGVAIFSVCAMIDRCLNLIQMVEIYNNKHETLHECRITFVVSMVAKLTSLLFIFLQTFFIFKYANIIINHGKNASLIGLMHIICTNLCVTFRTIIHETVTEIRHHNKNGLFNLLLILRIGFTQKLLIGSIETLIF